MPRRRHRVARSVHPPAGRLPSRPRAARLALLRAFLPAFLPAFLIAAMPRVGRAQGADSALIPPTATMIPRVDTTLGDERLDSYAWLRDDHRANPAVLAYLEAENRYATAALRRTEGLQRQLFDEMKARTRQTDLSVPLQDGRYLYYSRTVDGQQYPIRCRRKASSPDAPEEILLDENLVAAGHAYARVGVTRVSPDDRLLAFTLDTSGAERYLLVVKEIGSGRFLADTIHRVNTALEWAADSRTLFYGTSDSANRPSAIVRHRLGTPAAADSVVVAEPDVQFTLRLGKSKDRRFLFVTSTSYGSSDVRYLAADHPLAAARPLVARRAGVRVEQVDHRGHDFLVLTDDGAPNFRLETLADADPAHALPRDLVVAQDSVLLEGFDVFRDYLVLYERGHARHTIRVVPAARAAPYDVAVPDSISTFMRGANPGYDGTTLRYTYTSFTTPPTVIDVDLPTGRGTVRKVTQVLGDYDASRYRSERTWATATDGARVPISLVYRAPLVRDGTRPLLLTAYGAYGISTDPTFNPAIVSLLDRGVIVAIAHVRGGQEMGRAWYEQGRLLHKRNTFTDFIDAAEHLVADRYTSADRLAIRGASAGGLLIGAVLNMRPDLFHAAVADVPFVDVINTMSDPSIPLTTEEWLQWGDPRVEPYYSYMKSYSPYDNVDRKKYPALLVTAGLNDPRVGYWEPAKWVARLRASKTDDHLLLLRTNMGAGHGGASGRYDALHEQAIRYAFLLDQLGLSSATMP